jgi:hypothetical protein
MWAQGLDVGRVIACRVGFDGGAPICACANASVRRQLTEALCCAPLLPCNPPSCRPLTCCATDDSNYCEDHEMELLAEPLMRQQPGVGMLLPAGAIKRHFEACVHLRS